MVQHGPSLSDVHRGEVPWLQEKRSRKKRKEEGVTKIYCESERIKYVLTAFWPRGQNTEIVASGSQAGVVLFTRKQCFPTSARENITRCYSQLIMCYPTVNLPAASYCGFNIGRNIWELCDIHNCELHTSKCISYIYKGSNIYIHPNQFQLPVP